ncbi:MAG: NAD(P)-dependent oxidoreductase [Candidatus Pseudobacter hemicellulosilyticus]|uniref:NAD(P)-dependent oxidoreductase n=1 Tax=Candidatus Pseudobacter hemicellulosilyticus TaxID=3121375 RepID=A0AAJ5WTE5_9BACT|nr:MAG: NAD(P)-dependent oxidoreductase [Pseudobacter sp.]
MSVSGPILVTGATGFIGQYVVEALLQRNLPVIASSVHAEKARTMPWFERVRYIPFNLGHADPAADLYQLLGSPARMIHLSWEGLPNYKAAFHLDTNLPRQQLLLENLVRHGLRELTVTGTCFEYGMQEGALREDMETLPANPYALAKDQLRRYLESLTTQWPLSLKWVRLFYMYGQGQNPNSLLSQLDRALANGETVFNMSGGEQVRDFLPVEKVAEYLVRITLQERVTGIINCCSGAPVTVNQLVADHLRQKNKTILLNRGYYPYPDYEPMRFWGDNTKLKTILNNE